MNDDKKSAVAATPTAQVNEPVTDKVIQDAEPVKLDSIIVSTVRNAKDVRTTDRNVAAILMDIKGGKWKVQVGKIGQAYSKAKDEGHDPKTAVAELKKHLPGILWSGHFSKRAISAHLGHSGILCADLDHIKDRIPEVREKLKLSPHVLSIFISPTLTGLKVLFRVPAEASRHFASFTAVKKHVLEWTGCEIDESCKDVARLCFVSYDPELWENPAASVLPIPSDLPNTPLTGHSAPTRNGTGPAACGGIPPAFVIIPSGIVSYSEAAKNIFSRFAPAHTLFYRGGAIVEVSEKEGLSVVRPDAFRSRVESLGQVMAWRSDGHGGSALKPARMGRDDAAALMATLDAAEQLPHISSVVKCPVIVEAAEREPFCLVKGYHTHAGGLFILENRTPEPVPLQEAREAILELIEEFDFQSPGDHARACAAIITPGLRMGGLLKESLPIDVAEADQSQAGKGYRHSLICALYNEVSYSIVPKTGGVGSIDESFSAALIAGHPFVCLDNMRGRLDSKVVESFITAVGSFQARVPYLGEVRIDPKPFILQLSSNGMQSTVDLANRSSICRIRKRPGYQYRDTVGRIRERQPYFLGCVFSLIAEWIVSGKPRTNETRHDLKEWCQVLDWICQKLLGTAPLMANHDSAKDRAANPGLSWMREVALAVEKQDHLGHKLSASELFETSELHCIHLPGGDPKNSGEGAKQVGRICAGIFKNTTEIELEDFKIERRIEEKKRTEGGSQELRVYVFTKL